MIDFDLTENPFSVQTPEDISAKEALRLFVDVFTDFSKIKNVGHSMLNGPRGSGKSMMFRYLMTDCQCLVRSCDVADLPFFAVLVSIKNTTLDLTELKRFVDRHANVVLNEHLLVMYVASRVFSTLESLDFEDSLANGNAVSALYRDVFIRILRLSGWLGKDKAVKEKRPRALIKAMRQACDLFYVGVINYARRMAFQSGTLAAYRGPLCGYVDFLFPLLQETRKLPFMPDAPIYLLIDDADYLNHVQTQVLNAWIATRTSRMVSIKVSTQLRYKTFHTTTGVPINSPHDFQEVNISDLYTSSKGKYLGRVRQIVQRRLELAGISRSPEEFFPPDGKQEEDILSIESDLRLKWEESGRGFRASDDAVRYARPIYIAGLKGVRKAGSTYSYAGFTQLVHISSGLIRYFLEPAAVMYSEELAISGRKRVRAIRPRIQNEVIRIAADNLMFSEFERIFREEEHVAGESKKDEVLARKRNLHNLLKVLGGVFHQKLISDDAERRVFSVALSDDPVPEVRDAFELGMQFGYFHRSTIGNKDGTGRTALYVLTRRLAPYFTLDPNGFAGYLFVTSDRLLEGIRHPDGFLRRIKERGADEYFEERQLQLFE